MEDVLFLLLYDSEAYLPVSAFALDSSNLLENNHYGTLTINIIANVGLSIAALIGGKSLMSAIINN